MTNEPANPDSPENPKARGGIARAEALSPEERSEIARNAARQRWSQRETDSASSAFPKATHSGVLKIGAAEIPCYVLETGERILSTRGIMKSLGRRWRGRKYSGTEQPVFLEANNLKPFISNDLGMVLSPVIFIPKTGFRGEGFLAEALPAVCEIYLRARDAEALTDSQAKVAKQCDMLVRGLSRVGVIALVDEATGYQEVRDKLALQKILDRYLTAERAKWAKTFPDEFYKKLFLVRGLKYDPTTVKRPGFIGHDTNNIVYDRLHPGVLKKLQEYNPKTDKGYRRDRHHQFFTQDYGAPELKQHILNLMFLMDAAGSDNWKGFLSLLNRAAPRKGANLELEIDGPIS